MKEINDTNFIDAFVIEFAWDFQNKTWIPIQNRPDKTSANFITTCTDTVITMMDNVSANELIDACFQQQQIQQLQLQQMQAQHQRS